MNVICYYAWHSNILTFASNAVLRNRLGLYVPIVQYFHDNKSRIGANTDKAHQKYVSKYNGVHRNSDIPQFFDVLGNSAIYRNLGHLASFIPMFGIVLLFQHTSVYIHNDAGVHLPVV